MIFFYAYTGFWAEDPRCVAIIQTHVDRNEPPPILCEHGAIGLSITFFDKLRSNVFLNLCTDDTSIDTIINRKFASTDISLPLSSDLTTVDERSLLSQEIRKLERSVPSTKIFLIMKQRQIQLFGLSDQVQLVKKQIEDLKANHTSNIVKLNLNSRQVN